MLKDYMKRNYKVRLCDQICCTLDAATYLSADFFKQDYFRSPSRLTLHVELITQDFCHVNRIIFSMRLGRAPREDCLKNPHARFSNG